MELKIEKGIPLPPASMRSGLAVTLRAMCVGDSVFFAGRQSFASAMAGQIAKQEGKKFTTRKVEGGVRIWRVE